MKRGQQSGFVMLIAVLILAAVGTAIAITVLVLGTTAVRTNFAHDQSSQARALADACADHAIQLIADGNFGSFSGSLTLGAGTCTYTITNPGGFTRNGTATGTVGTVVRKLTFTGTLFPAAITAWVEVP